jgi:hypothetical protein
VIDVDVLSPLKCKRQHVGYLTGPLLDVLVDVSGEEGRRGWSWSRC